VAVLLLELLETQQALAGAELVATQLGVLELHATSVPK
jgi:hypothetical protein